MQRRYARGKRGHTDVGPRVGQHASGRNASAPTSSCDRRSQLTLFPGWNSDRPADRPTVNVDIGAGAGGKGGPTRGCRTRIRTRGSTSTRIRTRGCPTRHSGTTSHFQNVDVGSDSRLGTHKWRRHRIFKMPTSTRIRTLGCTKRYSGDSGAPSHFQNVDVDKDSHLWMHKTLFWCVIAFSESRRRQGFAPLHAQSIILVRHQA